MEQLKNQETIAARINEKIEQREIDKVRDKETAGKINESLGEIADELFDSVVDHFADTLNGTKKDAELEKEEASKMHHRVLDAVDNAFDAVVDRLVEKLEKKEENFEKDVETAGHVEENLTEGYKKIEDTVVEGYKKIEETVVGGFQKLADDFVEKHLVKEGESVEEAKKRLAEEQAKREANAKNHVKTTAFNLEESMKNQREMIEKSIEASKKAGKR